MADQAEPSNSTSRKSSGLLEIPNEFKKLSYDGIPPGKDAGNRNAGEGDGENERGTNGDIKGSDGVGAEISGKKAGESSREAEK